MAPPGVGTWETEHEPFFGASHVQLHACWVHMFGSSEKAGAQKTWGFVEAAENRGFGNNIWIVDDS